MWYDPERVGRYLDGKLMYYPWYGPRAQALKKKPPEEPPADWPHAGLGGGVFVCPSDAEKSGRSYDMNYWAATGHVLHPDEKIPWPYGELFDSNAAQLDKLMLFTDVIAIQKTARGWVTNVRLGAAQLPGQRFGGVGYAFWNDQSGRFYDNQVAYRTLLDYVRHGENQDRLLPEGAVNIGYADSHVELKRHDHLYDVDSKFSTYDTLWSPVDWLVEKGKGYAQRREISNDVQSIP
jgi:prepilin-type processing-associated H-X9-DG protein